MFRNKLWLWTIFGGGLGFLVVHPLIMVTARLMFAENAAHLATLHQSMLGTVATAFTYASLPWGVGFAILGALIAWLLVKNRRTQAQKERLRGVLELAGAASHELNQPMQVVLGYADLLCKDLRPDDPVCHTLKEITVQIARMDQILKKIRAITRYETQEYVEGIRIIDIHKASQ